jgi:hypothetical protein
MKYVQVSREKFTMSVWYYTKSICLLNPPWYYIVSIILLVIRSEL